jgi:hypothetical protein
MSGRKHARLSFALNVVLAVASVAASHALSTASTYQGQLQQSGLPAGGGTCDFRFSLHDEAAAGTQIGVTEAHDGVSVTAAAWSPWTNWSRR